MPFKGSPQMMPNGLSPFVDADGAAELLGVNANTVYLLISEGLLPAAKIGKPWKLRRQDVIDYVIRQIDEQTRQRKEEKSCDATATTLPSVMQRRRPRRADKLMTKK
jgi:excisionase family DNA binding protein